MSTMDGIEDLDLERKLRAALAPLAPDPAEFTAGVRERIERARRADASAERAPLRVAPWVRRAAALLPPGLTPPELGLAVGGAGAKQGAAGLLPGVLALPAVLLVGLLGSFLLVVTRARVAPGQRTDSARLSGDIERIFGGSGRWGAAGGAFAGPASRWVFWVLLFGLFQLDVLFDLGHGKTVAVLAATLSLLSLLLIVGGLSRAGLASRATVGVLAHLMLLAGLVCAVMNLASGFSDAPVLWPGLLAVLVLFVGMVACWWLSDRSQGRDLLLEGLRPRIGSPGRGTFWGLFLHLALVLGALGTMLFLLRGDDLASGSGATAELDPWTLLPLGAAVLLTVACLVVTLRAPDDQAKL
jgi:hypothetical protein